MGKNFFVVIIEDENESICVYYIGTQARMEWYKNIQSLCLMYEIVGREGDYKKVVFHLFLHKVFVWSHFSAKKGSFLTLLCIINVNTAIKICAADDFLYGAVCLYAS
jgi:hypothetical protein